MQESQNEKKRQRKTGINTIESFFFFHSEKVLKGGGTLVIGALLIKKQQGVFSNYLKGSLSNLNIWNRCLTADEVQNVYRACELNRGNVLYWCAHVIGPMLRNGATMTTPSSACSTSCKYNGLPKGLPIFSWWYILENESNWVITACLDRNQLRRLMLSLRVREPPLMWNILARITGINVYALLNSKANLKKLL